jgi:hypothetical protein
MQHRTYGGFAAEHGEPIARGSTGIRILLSLLFAVIWGVTESVLALVVVFSLMWTLITRQAPPERLRQLANRLVAYAYRIWRYLTYSEPGVPFPFTEFPDALEPTRDLGRDDASEVRDMIAARRDDELGDGDFDHED